MKPTPTASIDASFSYRIAGDEVVIAAVSGNPQRLLGFDAQAFLTGTVDLRALIHVDDADISARLFAPQANVTRQVANLRLRQADGRIRCVKCSYERSATAAGVMLDLLLEDAKSLPRTLNDAAAMANFRAMMDNTDDFIFFKDRNHVFTGASQTLVAVCDPAEHWTDLLGQTDYDVFPEAFADAYYKLEKQVYAGGDVAHEVQEYLSKEGRKGWVDNRKYPIRDATGEIVGLYGIARDITEQRRMQSAMLNIADFVAQDHGEHIFDAIAEFAASLFDVDYVHIALLEPSQTEVRVAAAWLDGKRLEPGYVYTLTGTPCENVMQRSHQCFADHVQQLFPTDHDLVELKAEGYIGEPIIDNSGQVLGLIVLVSHRPLVDSEDIVSGLRILAARAAADRALLLNKQALRQQRETLQLILDFAPIGIWLQDGNGKLSFVNKAFCSAMGIPEERFLAVPNYIDLMPEAFRPQCTASDAKALASEGISITHQQLPFVDGKVHDLRVIKAIKRNADGQPVALVGLSLDITDELQREQALKASEEAQRTLIAALPDVIMRFDREGRHLFVSDNVSEVAGLPASAFIGKTHQELGFSESLCAIWNNAIQQPFLSGRPHEIEFELDSPSGHVAFNWRLTPDADADGRVRTVLTVARNITERKRAEAALRESESRHRALFESAGDAIMTLTPPTWRFASGNSAVISMFGARDEADFTSRAPWQYSPDKQPDGRPSTDKAKEMIETALREGSHLFEWMHQRQNGEPFPATVLLSRFELNGQTLLQANVRDITARKKAEEALRLAANVFTHAREGITITDQYANILDVNAAFTYITGYSREEVLGKNPRILSSNKQDKDVYATMWHDLQSKGHWYGEIWNQHKDGRTIAEMMTISAVSDERGEIQNYIALFSDITTIKEHQAQLEYIGHYDALTGLPNRLLLGDRLRQAMSQAPRRGVRLAVAYLDLDGFKAVNDSHGHEVGDQLLATLAKRMTQVLRNGDTLGRLGGDEFVAVLVDLSDIEASTPILSRLLEAAAQPIPVGDIVLNVSASLGVTFYPQNEAVDADQLLRQADQAMYQAKQAGKNRYHAFDAEQDRHVRGRHESLEHIRQALAEREFVLFYQPKVNMRTGEILGAEALIRWQHPQRGLLPPAVFLPVVENQPLAIDLGEWVIDTALTQIEAWHADGLSIPVSVNVGAFQLQHPNFVSRLRTLLSRHPGVNPGDLELEVLETSALEDFAGVTQVMAACQELGVGFALDDFGTGYSSLTYLKQLPAGLLKVDQSFVHDMLEDPDDLAILEAVLALATAFRRQVIAEGVETLAHGEMLLRLGCVWAQGYAIARPMPAQDFQRWISTWVAPQAWKALKSTRLDRLPVLFAAVEHRAWISAMVNYLYGKRDAPPEQDAHQCRFGHWLDHGGQALLLGEAADHPVLTLHLEIHRLAAKLITLKHNGRAEEAQTRITELHHLRDQLLEQLGELY